MWIEFVSWPGNAEIRLLDDDGSLRDRFYTNLKTIALIPPPKGNQAPFDSRTTFQIAEEVLPKPVIGGEFSQHSPYWKEREVKRNG